MQFIAKEKGLVVLEVPVVVNYLEKPKRSPWLQGVTVLTGVLRLVGQYRPLMFFGTPGTLMLGAGFFAGLHMVSRYSAGPLKLRLVRQ